jgi:hypothetical protein
MTRQLVLGVWVVVIAGVALCEALSLLDRRRTASIGTLLEVLGASPVRLVALFVGWMWLGWHLFAR